MNKFNYNIKRDPIQLPYCCMPYCLARIIDYENLNDMGYNQKYIASYFDLMIPAEKSQLLNQFTTATISEDGNYGIRLNSDKDDINKNFFQKCRIPLYAEIVDTRFEVVTSSDLLDFIKKKFNDKENNHHIVLPLHFGTLVGKEMDIDKGWHMVLVEGYNENKISLCIPDEEKSFKNNYPAEQVFRAIDKIPVDKILVVTRKL